MSSLGASPTSTTPTRCPAISVAASFTDVDATDTHSFTVDTVSNATQGTVTNNNDGTFAYDPNGAFESLAAGETATDSFTYTVDDGEGGTSTATVTVTITGQNDAPVAVAATAAASEDGPVVPITVVATDADASDSLTYDLVTGPASGVVADLEDGNFTFDPNGEFEDLAAGETETVSFTYSVSDGVATATESVTVTVTGVNDDPVAADFRGR